MSLGLRSMSQSALKVCAIQNHAQPITSSCMVGFINYLAEMIITTRQYVVCNDMSLGQRSRLRLALKVCAFQNHVQPITSSCMVGFINYSAEMIITTRQYVVCNDMSLGQRSRLRLALSLCIPDSCPTHNFILRSGI